MRDDLVAHQGSPTKDPVLRSQTIRWAGESKVPFTSGILVGIGESRRDRIAAVHAAGRPAAERSTLYARLRQHPVLAHA